MKTRVCLKYLVYASLWKLFLPRNLPVARFNLICLTVLVTLRPLTQFEPRVRAIICKKSAKISSYLRTTFAIFSVSTKRAIESLSSLV